MKVTPTETEVMAEGGFRTGTSNDTTNGWLWPDRPCLHYKQVARLRWYNDPSIPFGGKGQWWHSPAKNETRLAIVQMKERGEKMDAYCRATILVMGVILSEGSMFENVGINTGARYAEPERVWL